MSAPALQPPALPAEAKPDGAIDLEKAPVDRVNQSLLPHAAS
jgi:hypothetical protein